ncbi:MAG: hypothetical protein NZM03_10365, partial [Limisphaera sp.]|nr:hypothetical protein [Limisphaera sp.]
MRSTRAAEAVAELGSLGHVAAFGFCGGLALRELRGFGRGLALSSVADWRTIFRGERFGWFGFRGGRFGECERRTAGVGSDAATRGGAGFRSRESAWSV